MTVIELFDSELEQYDQIPTELLRVRTLKDKLLYLYRMFSTTTDGQQSQCQNVSVTAKRKRPNLCVSIHSDSDSESSIISMPQGTKEQDLPGYNPLTRPPLKKRRKLCDPILIYSDKSDQPNTDGNKSDSSKATPPQASTSFQNATSSKSASKKVFTGQELSETLLNHISVNQIAECLNRSSLNQVSEKADELMNNERNTFDDMISDLFSEYSSSATSKYDTGYKTLVEENNRSLDTPLPNDPSKRHSYDLRSSLKTMSDTQSTESNKSSGVQILSDVIINQPIAQSIEISDEEPVSTTSQSQVVVQESQIQSVDVQPTYLLIHDSISQSYRLISMPEKTYTTSEQPQQFIQNSSVFTVAVEQSNNNILSGTINLQNQFTDDRILPTNNDESDCIIIADNDKENEVATLPNPNNFQSTSDATVDVSKEQSQSDNIEQTKEKLNPLAQFKVISGQKPVTPNHTIKPCTSKSLSTPRDKIKKVLDFNTPNRALLAKIDENKNESVSNTSRFFNETPHNQSITSTQPKSAPPKVDSALQKKQAFGEKSIVFSVNNVFVPTEQAKVVSAEGETPKVRKSNRRSCVRTISAHKEINHKENEKRLERVASTKKKICTEDGDSNDSGTSSKSKDPKSQDAAMEEWKRMRAISTNPKDFEQNLREQNSKKEEMEMSTGRKRSRRSKKKPIVKKKQTTSAKEEKMHEEPKNTGNPVDISLNSSLDVSMNSTIDQHARMLEENLKSAKKITPIKQAIHKSSKKKTPQIKLPSKSPKNKSFKKIKSTKNLTTPQTASTETVSGHEYSEKVAEVNTKNTTVVESLKKLTEPQSNDQAAIAISENTTDDLEGAQGLIALQDVVLQTENEKKMAPKVQTAEIQSDSVSMSQPVVEVTVVKTMNQPLPVEKINQAPLKNIAQPNMSMSTLLETPYKDNAQIFPRTPGITLSTIMPELTTPNP